MSITPHYEERRLAKKETRK
uniref:Uncharacterized protein n=1 Tax=Steinernema glaseri TaxID=37863 RepID=A0A1I7Y486_9BILA